MLNRNLDLTTIDGVVALMCGADSIQDWDARCDQVTAANGGNYPDFYFEAIMLSGLAHQVMTRFGSDAEIKIIPLE